MFVFIMIILLAILFKMLNFISAGVACMHVVQVGILIFIVDKPDLRVLYIKWTTTCFDLMHALTLEATSSGCGMDMPPG